MRDGAAQFPADPRASTLVRVLKMSAFDNISVEKKETLAYLTVNRPKALNALNKATLAEIGAALEDIRDDAGISGLIVTGAGDKASLGEGRVIESALFAVCASSEDKKEGTAAFMGKRRARFIGR